MGEGRGAEVRTRTAADCLVVQTPAQRHAVHVGDRQTVGRRADIAVAEDDQLMHEEVCSVMAGRDWSIEVPRGNVLWVDVLRPAGGGRLVSIGPGSRWSSSEPSVEVRIRTRAATYRFTIDHVTGRVASRVPATTRRSNDGMLQLHKAPHRALIAACADRLELHTATEMADAEVAARLGCSEGTAKRNVNRGLLELAISMELAGEVVPVERDRRFRAMAADWLVCTGTVTPELLARAIEIERAKGSR